MSREHFWFIDDEQRVRWAVRVATQVHPGTRAGGTARIYFTSREAQISTGYPLDKDEQELTRFEVRELLARAKAEAAGPPREEQPLLAT